MKIRLVVASLLFLVTLIWPFAAPQASRPLTPAVTVTVAGDQDFTLVNKTGIEIYSVYISPSKAEDWEDDILGQDTLPTGESVHISFARNEKAAKWDLR